MQLQRNLLLFITLTLLASAARVAAESPLQISIEPAAEHKKAILTWTHKHEPPFNLVFTNTSKKPQPVFRRSNSWGSYNVSFEITLPGHKPVTVTKKAQSFTRNVPGHHTILPGEKLKVPFTLDDTWKGRPSFKAVPKGKTGQTKGVKIKAIYSVKETPESKKFGVWTGKAESPLIEVTFIHR